MELSPKTNRRFTVVVTRMLLAVALCAVIARFVGLEQVPPILHYDESIGAADIACIGETGHSVSGEPWPLYTDGAGGGFYTPAYLYFGAIWTRIFGISIAAMRAIPAVFTSATILGVSLLARRIAGRRAGFWAFVLASLSPWGFHFSRVAWDPPVAAAFVVWFCYLWLLRRPWMAGTLSGLAFSLALYSYPPTRVQAPLLFGVLWLSTRRELKGIWTRSVCFSVASIATSIPLIRRMLDPDFTGRTRGLVIFSTEYLHRRPGFGGKLWLFTETLGRNLAAHFSPKFLLLSGDANLRHSTHYLGLLGIFDDFALALGLCLLLIALRRRALGRVPDALAFPLRRLARLGFVGLFLGFLPAALTTEGIPHALRSIGSWPFVSLIGAAILCIAERRWPKVVLHAGAAAVLHALLYGFNYATIYPRIARHAFGDDWATSLLEPAKRTDAERTNAARDDRASLIYFLMLGGRYNCDQARDTVSRWASEK